MPGGSIAKSQCADERDRTVLLRIRATASIGTERGALCGFPNLAEPLNYERPTPNYQHYWMADSDAANSLDRYETALWFLSRGDQCLNCNGFADENDALIIRVHKSSLRARLKPGVWTWSYT